MTSMSQLADDEDDEDASLSGASSATSLDEGGVLVSGRTR